MRTGRRPVRPPLRRCSDLPVPRGCDGSIELPEIADRAESTFRQSSNRVVAASTQRMGATKRERMLGLDLYAETCGT
jgi:hypothetical protein